MRPAMTVWLILTISFKNNAITMDLQVGKNDIS